MIDRLFISQNISDPDDRLAISKVLDKLEKSSKETELTWSDFLTPYQKQFVKKALDYNGYSENYIFFGGYEEAERSLIIFYPNHFEGAINEKIKELFKVIKVAYKGNTHQLTHRDFLGSLMGLGIKREKIGDILVMDNSCSIIVNKDIAGYIAGNLTRIGKAKVEVELKELNEMEKTDQKFKEIKGTVASLRLDSVASLGFGISRSKAADFIKADRVSVNWEVTPSLTKKVNEGDTISIQGKGRVVLEKVGGTTKKGRTSLELKKYI